MDVEETIEVYEIALEILTNHIRPHAQIDCLTPGLVSHLIFIMFYRFLIFLI